MANEDLDKLMETVCLDHYKLGYSTALIDVMDLFPNATDSLTSLMLKSKEISTLKQATNTTKG
ncbi:MAG: hypothetical protein ACUZ8H_09355 [Candidatus Anammoxibacter sp.]